MTKTTTGWADSPQLPAGVNLKKALALFAALQCFGPAAWAVVMIGLSSGWHGYGFGIALGVWAASLLLAGAVLVLAALQALPICRLISMTGYMSIRLLILSFCFLGIALAYGSSSLHACIWATLLGAAGVELYAWLNVRAMPDDQIINQMKDAFSKIDENGTFQLLTHGPGLPEDEMWLKAGVQSKLLLVLVLSAPFLISLAITGQGDAMAGPIMVTIGLAVYFLAVGSWAGQYALRRAIRLRLAGRF